MPKITSYRYSVGEVVNKKLLVKKQCYGTETHYKKNVKYYECQCLVCNSIVNIDEYSLKRGRACKMCSKSGCNVVSHINSIVAYENLAWAIDYFENGYEDAKKYRPNSTKKADMVCPHCKTKQKYEVGALINNGFSCHICSDKRSYPEKFIYALLRQCNVDFETQKRFTWSIVKGQEINQELHGTKIYDFYLPTHNIIIEAHGGQHYGDSSQPYFKPLSYQQANDKLKHDLAIKNGVHEDNYIVIDCRKSIGDFIKEKILESGLLEKINVNKEQIDFKKCERNIFGSLAKECCLFYESHKHLSTQEIAKRFHIDFTTLIKYLKLGNKLDWCSYETYMEKSEKDYLEVCNYYNKNQGDIKIADMVAHFGLNRNTIGRYLKRGQEEGILKYQNHYEKKSNIYIQVCESYNEGIKSLKELSKTYKVSEVTIGKYLAQGTEDGLCHYIPTKVAKPIEVYREGEFIGEFESARHLSIVSPTHDKIKTQLNPGGISKVCNGVAKQYKGFTFKFKQHYH